jgi:hypothetical protein
MLLIVLDGELAVQSREGNDKSRRGGATLPQASARQ